MSDFKFIQNLSLLCGSYMEGQIIIVTLKDAEAKITMKYIDLRENLHTEIYLEVVNLRMLLIYIHVTLQGQVDYIFI